MEEQLNPSPWLQNQEKLRASHTSLKSGHGECKIGEVELA
jgi:hypothetical protein